MTVTVRILKDIQLGENRHVFTRRCSFIEYDAKRSKAKKRHALIFQQGERYGTVGDCTEYVSQDELESLESSGHIRIIRRAGIGGVEGEFSVGTTRRGLTGTFWRTSKRGSNITVIIVDKAAHLYYLLFRR